MAAHASEYPVTRLGRVVGLARSGSYAWRKRPLSTRAQQDQQLREHIQRLFTDSRQTYGSPRVHAALPKDRPCGRKRVARLMRQAKLVARPRRRSVRTTDSRHTEPIAPNLLARDFTAHAPNRIWVTDITYLATREGWLYLAVVRDLYARRVVGWSMQDSLARGLGIAALRDAIQRRHPPAGLLHHSDRGSQYASSDDQGLLAKAQMIGRMSRKGNCWNHAVMESFFATLKAELPLSVFPSHAAARTAVFDYIERFYNRQRCHSSLGYRSPADYEGQESVRAKAA